MKTRREGRLSNLYMETLNIHKLPEGEHRDRDAACLAQQGPVCLTHVATRVREDAYTRRQELAAQQKLREQAQVLIDSNKLAADKVATATAAKHAEAARVLALSPEEIAAELAANKIKKEAKKLATALAKVEKSRLAAEKLREAHTLIAAGPNGLDEHII